MHRVYNNPIQDNRELFEDSNSKYSDNDLKPIDLVLLKDVEKNGTGFENHV